MRVKVGVTSMAIESLSLTFHTILVARQWGGYSMYFHSRIVRVLYTTKLEVMN